MLGEYSSLVVRCSTWRIRQPSSPSTPLTEENKISCIRADYLIEREGEGVGGPNFVAKFDKMDQLNSWSR